MAQITVTQDVFKSHSLGALAKIEYVNSPISPITKVEYALDNSSDWFELSEQAFLDVIIKKVEGVADSDTYTMENILVPLEDDQPHYISFRLTNTVGLGNASIGGLGVRGAKPLKGVIVPRMLRLPYITRYVEPYDPALINTYSSKKAGIMEVIFDYHDLLDGGNGELPITKISARMTTQQVEATGATGATLNFFSSVNTVDLLPVGSSENVGQFAVVSGGDIYIYLGSNLGATGPNNSYAFATNVTNESSLPGATGATGAVIETWLDPSYFAIVETTKENDVIIDYGVNNGGAVRGQGKYVIARYSIKSGGDFTHIDSPEIFFKPYNVQGAGEQIATYPNLSYVVGTLPQNPNTPQVDSVSSGESYYDNDLNSLHDVKVYIQLPDETGFGEPYIMYSSDTINLAEHTVSSSNIIKLNVTPGDIFRRGERVKVFSRTSPEKIWFIGSVEDNNRVIGVLQLRLWEKYEEAPYKISVDIAYRSSDMFKSNMALAKIDKHPLKYPPLDLYVGEQLRNDSVYSAGKTVTVTHKYYPDMSFQAIISLVDRSIGKLGLAIQSKTPCLTSNCHMTALFNATWEINPNVNTNSEPVPTTASDWVIEPTYPIININCSITALDTGAAMQGISTGLILEKNGYNAPSLGYFTVPGLSDLKTYKFRIRYQAAGIFDDWGSANNSPATEYTYSIAGGAGKIKFVPIVFYKPGKGWGTVALNKEGVDLNYFWSLYNYKPIVSPTNIQFKIPNSYVVGSLPGNNIAVVYNKIRYIDGAAPEEGDIKFHLANVRAAYTLEDTIVTLPIDESTHLNDAGVYVEVAYRIGILELTRNTTTDNQEFLTEINKFKDKIPSDITRGTIPTPGPRHRLAYTKVDVLSNTSVLIELNYNENFPGAIKTTTPGQIGFYQNTIEWSVNSGQTWNLAIKPECYSTEESNVAPLWGLKFSGNPGQTIINMENNPQGYSLFPGQIITGHTVQAFTYVSEIIDYNTVRITKPLLSPNKNLSSPTRKVLAKYSATSASTIKFSEGFIVFFVKANLDYFKGQAVKLTNTTLRGSPQFEARRPVMVGTVFEYNASTGRIAVEIKEIIPSDIPGSLDDLTAWEVSSLSNKPTYLSRNIYDLGFFIGPVVSMRPTKTIGLPIVVEDLTGLGVVVTDLEPGQMYDIWIRTNNSYYGAGEITKIPVTTLTIPTQPPIVEVELIAFGFFVNIYPALDERPGAHLYQYAISQGNSLDPSTLFETIQDDQITQLSPGTPYTISFRMLTNVYGVAGPATQPKTYTTATVPIPFPDADFQTPTPNGTEIILPERTVLSDIPYVIEYEIIDNSYYSLYGEHKTAPIFGLTGTLENNITINLDDVVPKEYVNDIAKYIVKLRATNGVGAGQWSSPHLLSKLTREIRPVKIKWRPGPAGIVIEEIAVVDIGMEAVNIKAPTLTGSQKAVLRYEYLQLAKLSPTANIGNNYTQDAVSDKIVIGLQDIRKPWKPIVGNIIPLDDEESVVLLVRAVNDLGGLELSEMLTNPLYRQNFYNFIEPYGYSVKTIQSGPDIDMFVKSIQVEYAKVDYKSRISKNCIKCDSYAEWQYDNFNYDFVRSIGQSQDIASQYDAITRFNANPPSQSLVWQQICGEPRDYEYRDSYFYNHQLIAKYNDYYRKLYKTTAYTAHSPIPRLDYNEAGRYVKYQEKLFSPIGNLLTGDYKETPPTIDISISVARSYLENETDWKGQENVQHTPDYYSVNYYEYSQTTELGSELGSTLSTNLGVSNSVRIKVRKDANKLKKGEVVTILRKGVLNNPLTRYMLARVVSVTEVESITPRAPNEPEFSEILIKFDILTESKLTATLESRLIKVPTIAVILGLVQQTFTEKPWWWNDDRLGVFIPGFSHVTSLDIKRNDEFPNGYMDLAYTANTSSWIKSIEYLYRPNTKVVLWSEYAERFYFQAILRKIWIPGNMTISMIDTKGSCFDEISAMCGTLTGSNKNVFLLKPWPELFYTMVHTTTKEAGAPGRPQTYADYTIVSTSTQTPSKPAGDFPGYKTINALTIDEASLYTAIADKYSMSEWMQGTVESLRDLKFRGAYTFNRNDTTDIPDLKYAKDDTVMYYSYVFNWYQKNTVYPTSKIYRSKTENNKNPITDPEHWELVTTGVSGKVDGDMLHGIEPILAYALQPPDPPVIIDIIEEYDRVGFTIKPPYSKIYKQNSTEVDDFLSANYYDGGIHKDSSLVFRANLSEAITKGLGNEQKRIYLGGIVPIVLTFKSADNVSKLTLQLGELPWSDEVTAFSRYITAGDKLFMVIPGLSPQTYVIKSIVKNNENNNLTVEYHDPLAISTEESFEQLYPVSSDRYIYAEHVPSADLILTPDAEKPRHETNTYWLNNCAEDTEYLVCVRLDNGWVPASRDIGNSYTKPYRVRTKRKTPPPPAIDSVAYEGGKFKLKYTYDASPVALYYNWQELSANDYTGISTDRRQLPYYYNIAFGLVDDLKLPAGEATIAQTKYDVSALAPMFTNSTNYFEQLTLMRHYRLGYKWPTDAELRDIRNDWPKPPYVTQIDYLNAWAAEWFGRHNIPVAALAAKTSAGKIDSVKYFTYNNAYPYSIHSGEMRESDIIDDLRRDPNCLTPVGLKNDPRGRKFYTEFRKYFNDAEDLHLYRYFPHNAIYGNGGYHDQAEEGKGEYLVDSPLSTDFNILGNRALRIPIYSGAGRTIQDNSRVCSVLYTADEYVNHNPYYESYADGIYFSVYRAPYRQKTPPPPSEKNVLKDADTSGYCYSNINSPIHGRRNLRSGQVLNSYGFYSIPAFTPKFDSKLINYARLSKVGSLADSIFFLYNPPFETGPVKQTLSDNWFIKDHSTSNSNTAYTELITASFPGMCFSRARDYDKPSKDIPYIANNFHLDIEFYEAFGGDHLKDPRTYDSFYAFSSEEQEEFYAATDFAINKFANRNTPTYMAFVCQSQNICCAMSSGNSSAIRKHDNQPAEKAHPALLPLEFRVSNTANTPVISWGHKPLGWWDNVSNFGYKESANDYDRYIWPEETRGLISSRAHGDKNSFGLDTSVWVGGPIFLSRTQCEGYQWSVADTELTTFKLDELYNSVIGMPKSHMTPLELGGAYDASWSFRHTKQLNKNNLGDTAPENVKDLRLSQPTHVALDMFNNMYIADTGNKKIKKVNVSNTIKNPAVHISEIENQANYGSVRTISTLEEFPGQLDVNYDGTIVTFLAGGKLYRRIDGVNYLVTTENKNTSNKIPAKNYQWPIYSASWGTSLPEDYDKQFISSFVQTTSGSTVFLNNGRGRLVKINCLTSLKDIDYVEYSFNNVTFTKYSETDGITVPITTQPGQSVPMHFRTVGTNGMRSETVQLNSDKVLQVNESVNTLNVTVDVRFNALSDNYTHKDGTTQYRPRYKATLPPYITTFSDEKLAKNKITLAKSTRISGVNNEDFVMAEAKQRLMYVRKIMQSPTTTPENLTQLKKEEALALQIIAAPGASAQLRSSDDWRFRLVSVPPTQGISKYDFMEMDVTIKFNASRNTGITAINPTPIPYTDYIVIVKNITKNRIFEITGNAEKYKYIKQKNIDLATGVITYVVRLYNDPCATESHSRFKHWRTRPIFEDSPPPAYEYYRVARKLKKYDYGNSNIGYTPTDQSTLSHGETRQRAYDAALDRGWYPNDYVETSGPDFSKGDTIEIYVVPEKTNYSKLANYTPYTVTLSSYSDAQLIGMKGQPVTY